jgi:hypothetical protein
LRSSRSATYSSPSRRIRPWTAALFVLLLWLKPLQPQVVDCIVAEVNGKAITLTDIRILQEFVPGPEPWEGARTRTLRQILEEAVSRRVVIDLVREEAEVTQKEADALLVRWRGRFDAGQWEERLAAFGLQEKALRPYLEEMVRYAKTIELRFGRGVEVSAQEIERHYEEVYMPSQRAMGREPKPLFQATPEIAARIKEEKAGRQAATWIRSLRAQAEVRINDRCLEQVR